MSANIGFRLALSGVVLGAGALVNYACTTTEVNPTDGGTTSTTTGTTTGTTTATSGTTSGTTGTTSGTTGTTGTTSGTTGTTTGTTTATSGTDAGCTEVPSTGVMADFSMASELDGGNLTFGTPGAGVFGGTYFYPAAGQGTATYYDAGNDACTGYCGCDTNLATSAFAAGGKNGGPWVFSGDTATYSGGGTWLSPCVNASAFTGIEITVSGSTNDPDPDGGSSNQLSLSVWQLSNWNVATAGGTCLAEGGTCTPVSTTFTIPGTNTPTPVTVKFSDLKGGVPVATLTDPSEIIQLQIQLPWTNSNCLTGATFQPNVSISKIAFVK